jgi:hypothetical protein
MQNFAVQIYPLTPTQLQVAYHSISNPGRPEVYAVQHSIKFSNLIDTALMREVLSIIVNRYAVLRGSVEADNDHNLLFHIASTADLDYTVIDLSDFDQQTIQGVIDTDRLRGFSKLSGSLCRFTVITYQQQSYLIWTFHHILMGSDSMKVMREILLAYQGGLTKPLRDG